MVKINIITPIPSLRVTRLLKLSAGAVAVPVAEAAQATEETAAVAAVMLSCQVCRYHLVLHWTFMLDKVVREKVQVLAQQMVVTDMIRMLHFQMDQAKPVH